MKRIGSTYSLWLFAAILMAGSGLLAQTKPAQVWASVQFNRQRVVVGEPLMVTVTVYTSTWFTSPPQFSEIQIPEAMMVEYPQRSGSVRKTIGNKSYPAIEKKFIVHPFKEGENRLPSLTIEVESPPEGDYKGKRSVIKSPERVFAVLAPPEGLEMENWLTAYEVKLTEKWSRPLENLKQGDVLDRTITLVASGALAALIPPMEPGQGDFGNVYAKTALLSNSQNSSSFTGTRVEQWTYLMESEGKYILPGLKVHWYNPASGSQVSAEIADQEVHIAANPDMAFLMTMQDSLQALLQSEESATADPFEWMGLKGWQLSASILSFILAIFLLIRVWRRIKRRMNARKKAHFKSEEWYYEKLKNAGKDGDPTAIMGALMGWFDHFREDRFGPGLEAYICAAGNPELQTSYQQLEEYLYAQKRREGWNGSRFVELIGTSRGVMKKKQNDQSDSEGFELNPGKQQSLECSNPM